MITWACCRARKSTPGAIISPLCSHFYRLLPVWRPVAESCDPTLPRVRGRINFCQHWAPSLILWGKITERCAGLLRVANEERRTATRRRPGCLLARRRRSTASLWLLFLRGTMCYQASFLLLLLHPPLAKHEVIAALWNCYACCFSGASGRVLSCAVLRERSPRAPQCEASPTNTATASFQQSIFIFHSLC